MLARMTDRPVPAVDEPARAVATTDVPPADAAEPRHLRLLVRAVQVSLGLVLVLVGVGVVRNTGDPLALVTLATVTVLVATYVAELNLRRRLAAQHEMSTAGLNRTLQQISRSMSSDAIVDTVIEELRRRADADHILVARLRPVESVVEATLASTRARVPPSQMMLPSTLLDPARLGPNGNGVRDAQRVANEIARRLSGSYALPFTIAAPLEADGRILGALIFSRRQERDWSPADRALLSWSTSELSAALARAFALEEAENQANIDALTGLPNRRYLEEILATIGPRRRSADRTGVLMIDIDHFKRLNDRYGHATGDDVLRAVSERISTTVRADDTPARYGGEEFAVLLRRATRDQAVEVAERIRAQISGIPPSELGLHEAVTVSIGVSVGDVRSADVHSLMESADRALYKAKRAGRDRVVLAG